MTWTRSSGRSATATSGIRPGSRRPLPPLPDRLKPGRPGLSLSGNGGNGRLDPGRIPEVAVAERPELRVQVIDERHAGRDVHSGDLLIGDAVEELHEGAQAVAVGHDEDPPTGPDLRHDQLVPGRQEAGDRVLERL